MATATSTSSSSSTRRRIPRTRVDCLQRFRQQPLRGDRKLENQGRRHYRIQLAALQVRPGRHPQRLRDRRRRRPSTPALCRSPPTPERRLGDRPPPVGSTRPTRSSRSASGTGTLTVDAAGTLVSPLVSVGALGTLDGNGLIEGSVVSEGLVSPGTSPGTLTVDGNFTQDAGGTLLMEIVSLTSFDQLNVSGTLLAGGTLEVDLLGYSPTVGDTFDLLDFASPPARSRSTCPRLPRASPGTTATCSPPRALRHPGPLGRFRWRRRRRHRRPHRVATHQRNRRGPGRLEGRVHTGSPATASTAVPEPTALTLVLFCMTALGLRRRANPNPSSPI